MVCWEVLDADCDEETRQAGDLGSLTSLYEVVKLAYLQPDEKLVGLPRLHASAAYGRVAVALDSVLFVFGEGCSSLLMQLSLEAPIDLILWIPQGDFLILGDGAGGIHCAHVQSQRVLITKHLPLEAKGPKLFIGGESQQVEDGTVSITLVTSGGHVIRINNIDPDGLSEGLRTGDLEHLKSLEEQMTVSVDKMDLGNSQITTVGCAVDGGDQAWVWSGSDNGVSLWIPSSLQKPSESLTWHFSHSLNCKRVIRICDGRYIVTLDTEGNIMVLCGVTGLTVWESTSELSVFDMTLLQSDTQSAQFMFVHQSPDSEGCLLRIMSFPGFTKVYELNVNESTSLVHTGEGAESIMFLEPDFDFITHATSCLKVKSIVDGVPEARLAKLLRKRKFVEAEEFCKRFGLDVEEVYKARAKYVCELMNPWNTSAGNVTLAELEGHGSWADELLATLGKIRDAEFVTVLCVEAALPDIITTKKILNYAKERLANTTKSEEGDQLSTLMQKVSESTYRLRTFETIFPSSDIQHWLAFSHTNMLEEFMEHLSRGNLDVASTVWHRHLYEFSHLIDQECVQQILTAFPHSIPSADLCNWLPRNVLSDLVRLCPSSMEIIACWGDGRVKTLEVVEKAAWPANGLALANTIISVLENVAADFQAGGNIEVQMAVLVAQWKAHSPSSALYHLRQTALALQDLKLLAEEFRIKIEFNQYTQENKEEVVAALLDWLVCGEEVAPLMKGFLRSYLVRYELDCDGTLARYVLETLATADQDWWSWQEAPWEDKLYAVIHVISDAQVRAQCIVECIHVAPVPWSEGTEEMFKLGLTLNTSLSSQLEDQRRFVGLKLVLRRYSLHLTNISDPRNAEMMLRNILSQEGDTVLEDALQVINTYKHLTRIDAYFYRIIHFLVTSNIDAAKSLLQGLDDTLQRQTSQKLIAYAIQYLMCPCRGQKGQDRCKAITGGVLALEAILKKWYKKNGTLTDDKLFATIHNVHTLQIHYEIYPTLRELEDSRCCKKLFSNHVTCWYQERIQEAEPQQEPSPNQTKSDVSTVGKGLVRVPCSEPLNQENKNVESNQEGQIPWKGIDHLHRLASLLKVPRGELLSLLASLAAKAGRLKEAVDICRLIIDDPGRVDCTSVVYEVVHLVVENQQLQQDGSDRSTFALNSTAQLEKSASIKSRAEIIDVIHDLVCSALTTAHPDLLQPLLELGLWCSLGHTLYTQCHMEGVYTQADSGESSNPYVTWKFSAVFNDASMPIEERLVTSVVSNAINVCLESHETGSTANFLPYQVNSDNINGAIKSQNVSNLLMDLISHLRDRGQDLLALSITLLMAQGKASVEKSPNIVGPPSWNQIFTLLLKVIGSKRPDVTLAVSLLTLLTTKKEPLKVLNELIKRFGYDYTRLQSVATVGKDFCTLYGLKEAGDQFSQLHKRATWGKRLADLNVSFKEAFKGDPIALQKVIGVLVAHPNCTFSILSDYCIDFNLHIADALLVYMKSALHSWSPECPAEEIRPGSIIKIESPRALLSKCQAIIAELKNKTLLHQLLLSELDLLSPYNYELLDLVLQQTLILEDDVGQIDVLKRGLDMLNFLKVYPRKSSPGNSEIDDWVRAHPQSLGPPPISKYRLPFHDFFRRKNVMKIVEPEMDITTVDIWLRAASTMKLSSDRLCMLATQNTVSRTLEQEASDSANSKSTAWQVCSNNSALLTRIRLVISKIQCEELATACANWVVNRLPPGADKVEAAEKCKLLAEQWKDSTSDGKAVDAFTRMSARHQQLAIEHTLHKYGLAEPQYLSLTRTPVDLVFALYQHPCLDSLATLSTHSMPDINCCVSEICTVAGCHQSSIQLDLLEKWLPPPEMGEGIGTEETVTNFKITLDPGSVSEDDPTDDASLSRVIYVLRCCPQNEAVSYLLNRALSDDTSVSAAHRLRALRCLLAIAEEETIQKFCTKGVTSIRSFLQTITYVSRLESLGHATSVQQFNSMDKNALVEGLWRSQRHNPQALTLLTDLCRDYQVTTASLWGAVLTQLTNFIKSGQLDITTLERVLLQVKSLPHLWVVPALTTAWTTLINYPFTKATSPVDETSLASCVHSIDLLLRHCPVVVSTAPLLKHCVSLDLPALGLAIAAADQVECHDLQAMINKTSPEKLKTQYEKLKQSFAFPRNVEDLLSDL